MGNVRGNKTNLYQLLWHRPAFLHQFCDQILLFGSASQLKISGALLRVKNFRGRKLTS